MNIVKANSALIQPKDRDYNRKGLKHEERLEVKTDEIAHAQRAGIRSYVVIEFETEERSNNEKSFNSG
jgi:hypothetical protein